MYNNTPPHKRLMGLTITNLQHERSEFDKKQDEIDRKGGGIKLEDLDRHIILYIKGHYKEFEQISLQSIFAQWCSLYVSQVEERQVMNMMLRSYKRLIELGIFKVELQEMFGEMFAANRRLKGSAGEITPAAIISYIGQQYYDLQINDDEKNLIDLGEIDPTLASKIDRLIK